VDAAAQAGADWPGLPVADGPRGVSGHSMGGGAAVLAAARDPAIGAVATLAAADTRPSSIEAARALTAPTLYVAASDDAITPLDQHQRPMFEASGQVTAQLRIIEAASHCGFLDEAVLVGLVCDEAGIAGAYQLALAREALVAWLRLELMGDAAARDLAWPGEPQAGLEIVAHRGRV
jgi:dienelactone hydrolase